MIEIILFVVLFIFTYFFSALVHELGHVLVGLANGWKLLILVIGPLGLKRKDEELVVYLEKNPVLWAGVGGTYPSEKNDDNIKIWSKILLAGPIASIISGIIFLIVNYFHYHIAWLMLGAVPIGMGVACLLPLKTGLTYTDGKRWWRLMHGGQGAEEEKALFKMLEYDLFIKDKSLMKKQDFEALLDAKLPAIRYYGYYYLYQFSDVNNDLDHKAKALKVLNELKSKVPKIVVDDCKL